MTETIPQYNARCKEWGETDPGYRALQVGTTWTTSTWPAPPTAGQTDMGAKWADFVDDTYRPWGETGPHLVPPPGDPQYSGGNSPPPAPPSPRKKN